MAITGRPNVGKSTLMNRLVEEKISIASRKPQTTRWQVRGIRSTPEYQIVFTDTPGYQRVYNDALHRFMNREVTKALAHVDVVLFVVEALKWNQSDTAVARLLRQAQAPLLLVINKLDLVQDKTAVLPYIRALQDKLPPFESVPVSARRARDMRLLERSIAARLPAGAPLFPPTQCTDRSPRFIATEYIREKAIMRLGAELPYKLTVTLETFADTPGLLSLGATIWAERDSHRAIIIGKGGGALKSIATGARKDLEKFFAKKVFLQIRVRIKKNWTEDVRGLRAMGYE